MNQKAEDMKGLFERYDKEKKYESKQHVYLYKELLGTITIIVCLNPPNNIQSNAIHEKVIRNEVIK